MLGDLVANLVANTSGFTKPVGDAQKEYKGFIATLTGSLAQLGLASAGINALFAVGRKLTWGIELAAQAEQMQVAFSVMLGSGDAAKKMLADLNQFAASTPFELPGIQQAARTLLAFGFQQEEIMGLMRTLGDVSAGTGKDLSELAVIYGQIRAAGRLMGGDLLQLINAGVPIIGVLAKQFGVAEGEIKKMVERGQIGFPAVQKAFESMSQQGGVFENMMKRQSGTLAGLWSTLKDNISALARETGDAIVEGFDLKTIIEQMTVFAQVIQTKWVPAIREFVTNWGRGIAEIVVAIGVVVAAFRLWALAQLAVAKGQTLILSLAGPAGWKALAVGAALFAGSLVAIDTVMDSVIGGLGDVAAAGGGAKDAVAGVGKAAKDAITPLGDVGKAIEAMANRFSTPAEKLQRDLQELAQLRANAPNDQHDALFGVMKNRIIDANTGIFKNLKDVQDELKLLRGEVTETDLKLHDMLLAGAPPDAVQELRRLMDMRDILAANKKAAEEVGAEMRRQMDDMRRAADAAIAATMSPAEKFRAEVEELQRLVDVGLLTDEQFAKRRGQLEQGLTAGMTTTAGPRGATRGSSEALSSIFSAMRSKETDTAKRQLKAQEQALAEAKRQTQLLERVADFEPGAVVPIPL